MHIGVLGGGQLGRMLALAGYPLGFQFRFLDDNAGCPAGQIAPVTVGSFDDARVMADFCAGLDVITYEFENVPVTAVKNLERANKVFPSSRALETSRDRVVEKNFFNECGLKTPAFLTASSEKELRAAVNRLGFPCVLKTCRWGYDGKGQVVIRSEQDIPAAVELLQQAACIVESFVPFSREISILAVRGADGEFRCWPPVHNFHSGGILRLSIAPAHVDESTLQAAQEHAHRIMQTLDYVGVLAIELFEIEGELLANEMAPRVHNSGHWTIEGAQTSQFENHVRAISGLPLGATEARGHAAMINLVGSVPRHDEVLSRGDTHLHLYGKEPREGRKLGHITICDDNPNELLDRIAQLSGLSGVLIEADRLKQCVPS